MKYAVFVLILFLFSCRRDKSCELCGNKYVNAVILNEGIVAADGCDWVIKTDTGDRFHPEILVDSFKQHGLQVKVYFENTGANFICGFNPNPLPVIRVIDIKQ